MKAPRETYRGTKIELVVQTSGQIHSVCGKRMITPIGAMPVVVNKLSSIVIGRPHLRTLLTLQLHTNKIHQINTIFSQFWGGAAFGTCVAHSFPVFKGTPGGGCPFYKIVIIMGNTIFKSLEVFIESGT